MKVLVIDTETGGLDAGKHSILELGAVVWENNGLNDIVDYTICESTIVVDPYALKVNKIDLRKTAEEGENPTDVVWSFNRWLEDNFGHDRITLAGYNVSFDVDFLKRLYSLAPDSNYNKRFTHRTIDIASIVRGHIISSKIDLSLQASSDETWGVYGVTPADSERHTARGDAIATANLLTAVLNK